jgi:TusA-related sulfurtransferase
VRAQLLQLICDGYDEHGIYISRVNIMPSTSYLNLVGIAWPVCLLKFKNTLNGLCSCDLLEVSAHDPDVVSNLIMIVERSDDLLIDQQKKGEVYRLRIRKGP